MKDVIITARSRELHKRRLDFGSLQLSQLDRKLPPALHYFHGGSDIHSFFPLRHLLPREVPGDLLDPGPQGLDVCEDVGVASGDRRGLGFFTLALAAEDTVQLPHTVVVAAHKGRAEVGLQLTISDPK